MSGGAVLEAIAILEGAYRVKFNQGQVQTWCGFLARFEDDAIRRAAQSLVDKGVERLPSLPAFVAMVREANDEIIRTSGVVVDAYELRDGEERSLPPDEQFGLIEKLRAVSLEMDEAKAPVGTRTRILTATAVDVVNEARKKRGLWPL